MNRGEQRVFDVFIVNGWRNKLIAAEIGKSEGTVKIYMSRLIREFGVTDRSELIAKTLWAKIHGLQAMIAAGSQESGASPSTSPGVLVQKEKEAID